MKIPGTIVIFFLCANFFGANAMSKEPTVEIQLGETGASFSKRNSTFLKIDRQPAGLNFYQIKFRSGSKGRVIVKFDDRKFSIENVLNVTGTEDLDFREEGLLQFEINSGLTGSDLIAHDEARLRFFSILQNIERSGWKTTIPLSMARLRGREMTRFLLTSKRRTTLDPSYVPTLEEWMQMRSLTSWKFYTKHMYLTVSFTREHTLTDPSKPGAYLLSFELRNESEQFRRHVDGLDRNRWREVLPVTLRESATSRAKMEQELRSKGIAIDENYTDPPVPDLGK
jgi:hypothetical protein